jgi:hypothetical protein
MWRTAMPTGLRHEEARENDGLLCELAMAGELEKEAMEERWYHNAKVDIRDPFSAGYNESQNTAERRAYPGYLKRETRSSDRSDWRDVTSVSPSSQYLYSGISPFAFLLHAGLTVSSQHHCLALNSYCSSSLILLL